MLALLFVKKARLLHTYFIYCLFTSHQDLILYVTDIK